MIKVGVIGESTGNGHPFSFSAIINGYNKEAFQQTPWGVILTYLEQHKEQVGIEGVKVTHVWTQFSETTKQLSLACNVATSCNTVEEMLPEVDAVLIARDDEDSHYALAKPFLEAGRFVFIDKPLSLKKEELSYFSPYLAKGQLMSTSGLRYANELQLVRKKLPALGQVKLIEAIVVNDFIKYGIHMLDVISSLGFGKIVKALRLQSEYEGFSFQLESGITFNLHCLGKNNKIFKLNFYGELGHFSCELNNNFLAFKNTLLVFKDMILTQTPPFNFENTLDLMQVLKSSLTLKKGEAITL